MLELPRLPQKSCPSQDQSKGLGQPGEVPPHMEAWAALVVPEMEASKCQEQGHRRAHTPNTHVQGHPAHTLSALPCPAHTLS